MLTAVNPIVDISDIIKRLDHTTGSKQIGCILLPCSSGFMFWRGG